MILVITTDWQHPIKRSSVLGGFPTSPNIVILSDVWYGMPPRHTHGHVLGPMDIRRGKVACFRVVDRCSSCVSPKEKRRCACVGSQAGRRMGAATWATSRRRKGRSGVCAQRRSLFPPSGVRVCVVPCVSSGARAPRVHLTRRAAGGPGQGEGEDSSARGLEL